MSEIARLQAEIGEWADRVFPDRTIQSAALKLYEEIGEMLRNPGDPSEHADIYIMMFDLSRMYGVDIAQAVRDKMAINRMRSWKPTAIGTLQHSSGAADNDVKKAYDLGVTDFRNGRLCAPSFGYRDDLKEAYVAGYQNANGENEGSEYD